MYTWYIPKKAWADGLGHGEGIASITLILPYMCHCIYLKTASILAEYLTREEQESNFYPT